VRTVRCARLGAAAVSPWHPSLRARTPSLVRNRHVPCPTHPAALARNAAEPILEKGSPKFGPGPRYARALCSEQ
jgi:hypothetical protein